MLQRKEKLPYSLAYCFHLCLGGTWMIIHYFSSCFHHFLMEIFLCTHVFLRFFAEIRFSLKKFDSKNSVFILFFQICIFFSMYTDTFVFQYTLAIFFFQNTVFCFSKWHNLNKNEHLLIWMCYKCNIFNHVIISILVHVIKFREIVLVTWYIFL